LSTMLLSSPTAFCIVILTSFASCALNPESLQEFSAVQGLRALEFTRSFTAKHVGTGAHSQHNHPSPSLRSERLAEDILLEGYLFVDEFSDDDCSEYVKGTTFKLNTCISVVCSTSSENGCYYDIFKAHYIVTATSLFSTITYYNDFKCTEKTLASPAETTFTTKSCSSRSKKYVSSSYLLPYQVPHVTQRQETSCILFRCNQFSNLQAL
jgi:hypothetical protein